MYSRQLSTFLSVAETGSFSRTAALLFITPSAVNQQVTRLEQDIGAELFVRGRHGLSLTPAGLYLQEQASAYVRLGDEIVQRVRAISRQDRCITIGTDLDQKVRLLFDLWMVYPGRTSGQTIQLVNIDVSRLDFQGAQLIESVLDESPWTKDWTFLQMMRVPFGVGFSRNHPLYRKDRLGMEDLLPYPIIVPAQGAEGERIRMVEELRAFGIAVLERPYLGAPVVWEASEHLYPVLMPLPWADIFFDLSVKPCS